MTFHLASTAPHISPARDWQHQSGGQPALILYKSLDSPVEVGLRRYAAGATPFFTPNDRLCYVFSGRTVFHPASGEPIEVLPDTAIHFKQGWSGELRVTETLDVSYMTCEGGCAERAFVLGNALTAAPLKDWGAIPTMIEGESRTAGILLSREPNGRAESGLWTCTPGSWRCEVTSDEYCHFLDGSCVYTHDNGERIVIEPDTLAFFPRGWSGRCDVQRTIRKVYMIR